MDHPIERSLAAAAARAAGEAPILVPSLGGSLPLYLFEEKLGAPVVIVPIANHVDNQHAPDENLRIANLWYGVVPAYEPNVDGGDGLVRHHVARLCADVPA